MLCTPVHILISCLSRKLIIFICWVKVLFIFFYKKGKMYKQVTSLWNQYIVTLHSYYNTMHFKLMKNNKCLCVCVFCRIAKQALGKDSVFKQHWYYFTISYDWWWFPKHTAILKTQGKHWFLLPQFQIYCKTAIPRDLSYNSMSFSLGSVQVLQHLRKIIGSVCTTTTSTVIETC